MRIREEEQTSFYKVHGKRMLDIIASLILILFTWPVFVLAAVVITFTNGGPVLFSQTRVGQHGELFTIWKFRSMIQSNGGVTLDMNEKDGVPHDFLFKNGKDCRVTKIGAILRKYSIDELPQLVNVLKGDMSIVGPRPEVPEITNLYNQHQRKRLNVKPGLTGLAQVNGRSIIAHGRKIELDLAYIEKQSFLLDIKIIFRTFFIVLSAKGAY